MDPVTTPPAEIADWLQQKRSERGWSQSELARLVGVSQATISVWERGKGRPDDVQMEVILEAFDSGVTKREIAHAPKDLEGEDKTSDAGWGGEYPLDAVFVRTDQRTAGDIVRRINNNRYDLNPEFQRDFVWHIDKQSRLIESCLMRIPLPVLYVAEASDGRIIVVDGLQRLTTFKRFIGNEFKLTFAKFQDAKPHPLEGKRFDDLGPKLQERVEDTQLTLYILEAAAPERAKLDIFERVNSGEPLTRQQMRNCLYNGPATRWLKEAAMSDDFRRATGNSLDSDKMRDREVINRFCAFSILGWKRYNSGDMDGFLAEALGRMNSMPEADLAKLRSRFNSAMETNFSLFGRHAFRKSLIGPSDGDRSILNIALLDVCSVLLATLSRDVVSKQQGTIRRTMRELLNDESFVTAITYSTNSRKQVQLRFREMEARLNEALK